VARNTPATEVTKYSLSAPEQTSRPFLLDRVLRGDGEERVGQRVGGLSHRHLALLHRLQQGRLRLGGRAVDLVGQQDVGEHRPFHEAEVPPAVLVLLQHVGARDVRGHQVRRELDPLEADIEDAGQRADHQRFGQPRHAHQQAVSAREDGGEDLFDDLVLADDDFLQLALHHLPMLGELLQHVPETFGFVSQRAFLVWGSSQSEAIL
jgi:hypothetical protein